MTARHDYRRERNRPVRNALLKWQLQQDQRRLAEVQQRLMRMAAPSLSSSLGLGLDSSDRPRPTLRRTRPLQHHDPEEDASCTSSWSGSSEKPPSNSATSSTTGRLLASSRQNPVSVRVAAFTPSGGAPKATEQFFSQARHFTTDRSEAQCCRRLLLACETSRVILELVHVGISTEFGLLEDQSSDAEAVGGGNGSSVTEESAEI